MIRLLLRVASAGGWLANFENQRGGPWNSDNSEEVGPGFLVVGIIVFAFAPSVIGVLELNYMLGFSSAPPLRSGGELALVPFGLFGLIAVWLAVGWLVRFVPFVADKDQSPPHAAAIPCRTEIQVHATGIFGMPADLRRFRHRPARIEKWEDGELDVYVKRNRPLVERVPRPELDHAVQPASANDGRDRWPVSQAAALRRGNVRKVRRGTAHLVSEARPAIELVWSFGPILLDFEDVNTRDQVFGELRGMLADAPDFRQ